MSKNLARASGPAFGATRSPSKIRAVGIVIAARDQAATIPRCIAAIFAANSSSGWRNSLWIVVVADSCTDDTARAARDALGAFGQVLEVCACSAQAAHQIGAATLLEHFHGIPRHALLLTSADATVELPRDWIDIQLRQGAERRLAHA